MNNILKFPGSDETPSTEQFSETQLHDLAMAQSTATETIENVNASVNEIIDAHNALVDNIIPQLRLMTQVQDDELLAATAVEQLRRAEALKAAAKDALGRDLDEEQKAA